MTWAWEPAEAMGAVAEWARAPRRPRRHRIRRWRLARRARWERLEHAVEYGHRTRCEADTGAPCPHLGRSVTR